MDKQMLKDIRKVAFTVGFGLTLGKTSADLISAFACGVLQGMCIGMANEGNKLAQSICKRSELEYSDKSDNEPKAKIIGFQCE